jgi:hypothetical protein
MEVTFITHINFLSLGTFILTSLSNFNKWSLWGPGTPLVTGLHVAYMAFYLSSKFRIYIFFIYFLTYLNLFYIHLNCLQST